MLTSSLRAIHEVAQCGSIRKASDKLGLAPSSVSRRLAILEQQIGTQLFDRCAGGVKLTHAGRLVAEFAGPVIFDYEALCKDLNDLRGSRRQMIRVGATASIFQMRPAKTIASFRERFDSVVFQFDSFNSDDLVRLVKAGDYDIGIALKSSPDPDIEVIARIAEPTMLVVRGDHPLAARTQIGMPDLDRLPMAVLSEQYSVRHDFDIECKLAGVKPEIVLESTVLLLLADCVRSGLGASLMPLRTVDPDLVALPIDCQRFRNNTIELIVKKKRRLPRMVRLFVAALAEDIAREVSQGKS